MTLPKAHQEALFAAVDLVGRAGGKSFEVGYLNEVSIMELADWWASALVRGNKFTVEHKTSPIEAAEALAIELLSGAQCMCGKLVALSADGAFAFAHANLVDGRRWNAEDAAKAGQCRWRRVGARWYSACGR